jgi:5-methylcytosine-specific restriction protein A
MHRDPRIRGRAGVKLRLRRLALHGFVCGDCKAEGRIRSADVIDHIKPLAMGGLDTDDNTRALCHECHRDRTTEQFGHRARPRIGVDGWPE